MHLFQITDGELRELRKVGKKLNDRPRKRLDYRTPVQAFQGEYSGAALIALIQDQNHHFV